MVLQQSHTASKAQSVIDQCHDLALYDYIFLCDNQCLAGCVFQEQSEQGQQQSVARIGQLEREASDSRDVHLALAAQHESKVPSLHCTASTRLPCT